MKTIIFLLILCSNCYAANISQPPILKDEPVQEQQYLKQIADNLHVLEVTTTNPDGSRIGKYGEMIMLLTGGNYYLEICTSSPTGTVWRGTQITDIP